MILDQGVAWNGETTAPVQVAKAMTGASWNGHRFFGLRTARSDRSRWSSQVRDCDAASSGAASTPIKDGGAAFARRPNRRRRRHEIGEGKTALRCAIYTRVSTEHGLEQEFNSLDNQREASEAYVKSQAHEGWKLIRTRYDDGGYSGGSMERPALQKLLDDVRAHRIDVIVVYKVDRLDPLARRLREAGRTLRRPSSVFRLGHPGVQHDDQHGTIDPECTSSFAQFSAEVTGERIRDKIAASKRKGIWMGAWFPWLSGREPGAPCCRGACRLLRDLFRRYLEIGSVVRLKAILDHEDARRHCGPMGRARLEAAGLSAGAISTRSYRTRSTLGG